jgi:hypothetical protein
VAALLPVLLAHPEARAELTLVPDSVYVDSVKLGTSFVDTILLSDVGAGVIIVDSVKRVPGVTEWTDSSYSGFPANLSADSAIHVLVRFTPGDTALIKDSLFIYYNRSGTDTLFRLRLQGQGAIGRDSIAVSSINFGSVTSTTTKQDSVRIYNKGKARLRVRLTMQGGDASFVATPDSFTVAPGASQKVTVSFTPPSAGARAEQLVVAHDGDLDLADTSLVALSGTGVAPQFVATPPALSFGSVRVGDSLQLAFRVTNPGNTNLIINSVSGPFSSHYVSVQSPAIPDTVAPNTDTSLWVIQFEPNSTGTKPDSIRFTTNVPGSGTIYYMLSGQGTQPDIDTVPGSLNFGQVAILDADTLQVDVLNVGNDDLVIDSVRMRFGVAPYTLVQTIPNNSTIAPALSAQLRVRFAPTLPDSTFADTIIVYSDDPDEPIVRIPIVGQSVVAAVRLTKTSVAFDTVLIGNSRAESLYVVNDGTDTLTFNTDTLTNAQYAVVPNSGNVLAGDSLKVRITFAPTAIGNADALWRLNTNVPSSPTVNVNLTAYGASRLAAPSALNFGNVTVGQAATLPLPIRNRGTTSADTLKFDTIRVQNSDYTITDLPAFPYVLAPGASDTFTVRFTPTTAAVINDAVTFEITAPAADLDSVVVQLTGTGVASTKTVVRFINYPNPFVPDSGTTVLFGLGRAATVTVTVYDLSGQLLAELTKNQAYPIGEHELAWDGQRYDNAYVAYGVYICEVVATPSGGGEEEREYRKLACGRR